MNTTNDIPPRPEEDLAAAEAYRLEQCSTTVFHLLTPTQEEFVLQVDGDQVTGWPRTLVHQQPEVVAELTREILAL